jgi:N-methylhydantoinase A
MIGVDVGGTFTDVVAWRDGRLHVTKVPSVPTDPQQAVLEGARRLGVAGAAIFNHASTKGLNAVLTRNIPKIGFLTTAGHRDADAGRAWRPFEGQLDARHRPFGDVARPLVPRYLQRGARACWRAGSLPLGKADALARTAEALPSGASHLPAARLCRASHERRLADSPRGARRHPLSVSSEARRAPASSRAPSPRSST